MTTTVLEEIGLEKKDQIYRFGAALYMAAGIEPEWTINECAVLEPKVLEVVPEVQLFYEVFAGTGSYEEAKQATNGAMEEIASRFQDVTYARLPELARSIMKAHLFWEAQLKQKAYHLAITNRDEEVLTRVTSEMQELLKYRAAELVDTWEPLTLHDAYQERPPRDYVVNKLVERPGLFMAYAPPGDFKSLWVADLAVCVAAGVEHLPGLQGAPGFPTKQAPVIWLDLDNGKDRTLERFEALARARDLPEDTPLFMYSMPSPTFNARDADSIILLEQRIKRHGAGLLVVDTFIRASGGANENDAEIDLVMTAFRQLAERNNLAIILIHHANKSETIVRRGNRIRGHSSIEAGLDRAFQVERQPYDDQAVVYDAKERGASVPPFVILFTFMHKPGRDELGTAKFFGEQGHDLSGDRGIKMTIREATVNKPQNKTTIVEYVKNKRPEVGINRIRTLIDSMAAAGDLSTYEGSKPNETLYGK